MNVRKNIKNEKNNRGKNFEKEKPIAESIRREKDKKENKDVEDVEYVRVENEDFGNEPRYIWIDGRKVRFRF